MTVEIIRGLARFHTTDGRPIEVPVGPAWWDDEGLMGVGGLTGLLAYELANLYGEDLPLDYAAVAGELDELLPVARQEYEQLAALHVLREGLGIGELMSTLRARPEPDTRWLVPGMLALGSVTFISGREKRAGKSTLISYLMGALERDEPTFFGDAYGEPVKTIWLTEEPEFSLREKGEDFDLRDVYIVPVSEWLRVPDLDLSTFPAKLAAAEKLAEGYGAKLVVIDPLSRIAGITDEAGTELGHAVDAASQMAQRAGLAVVLIHHDNKRAGATVEDKMRGSTSGAAAADQIVHIDRPKPRAQPRLRRLVSWGRVRACEWERDITLNDDHTYTSEDVQPDNDEGGDLLVLHTELVQAGPCKVSEFIERRGHEVTRATKQSTQKQLDKLVEAGQATRTGSQHAGYVYAAVS
jgi:hypothetical protein